MTRRRRRRSQTDTARERERGDDDDDEREKEIRHEYGLFVCRVNAIFLHSPTRTAVHQLIFSETVPITTRPIVITDFKRYVRTDRVNNRLRPYFITTTLVPDLTVYLTGGGFLGWKRGLTTLLV